MYHCECTYTTCPFVILFALYSVNSITQSMVLIPRSRCLHWMLNLCHCCHNILLSRVSSVVRKFMNVECYVCLSCSIAYMRSIDISLSWIYGSNTLQDYCFYPSSEVGIDLSIVSGVRSTNAALTPWVETTNGLRYYWPPQRKSALAYREWDKSIWI